MIFDEDGNIQSLVDDLIVVYSLCVGELVDLADVVLLEWLNLSPSHLTLVLLHLWRLLFLELVELLVFILVVSRHVLW